MFEWFEALRKIRKRLRLLKEILVVAQSILDAQAHLATAVAAVDAKVTQLLATQADPTSMTAAEQATLAADLDAVGTQLDAIAARTV